MSLLEALRQSRGQRQAGFTAHFYNTDLVWRSKRFSAFYFFGCEDDFCFAISMDISQTKATHIGQLNISLFHRFESKIKASEQTSMLIVESCPEQQI